jgi:hypothetical protein
VFFRPWHVEWTGGSLLFHDEIDCHGAFEVSD